jgi:opacity protein-like surface antigen
MNKQFLLGVLLALMLSSGAAFAQVPQTTPVTGQVPQSQSSPEVIADTDEAQTDEANESESEEEDDSPSRFIPTEQISQDLGVSFPADI